MKKSKIKKLIKALIFSTFICLAMIFCFFTNNKYPSYNIIEHNCDEEFTFNGLNINFNSFEIYTHEDFIKKFPNVELYDDNQINMIVSMGVKNFSDSQKIIPFDQFVLECTGWYSSICVKAFFSLNPGVNSYKITVPPKAYGTIQIPFTYYSSNIHKDNFKDNIYKSKFHLNIYMSYPQKIIINL